MSTHWETCLTCAGLGVCIDEAGNDVTCVSCEGDGAVEVEDDYQDMP